MNGQKLLKLVLRAHIVLFVVGCHFSSMAWAFDCHDATEKVDPRLSTPFELHDADKNAAPEPRIKFVTAPLAGETEKADPAAPQPFIFEGGTWYRIDSSGKQTIIVKNLDDFFRGDVTQSDHRKIMKIKLLHEDGTEFIGPYHTGDSPWDRNVVSFDGKLVGYAGVMVQPYLQKNPRSNSAHPNADEDNHTRSRHAFDISYEKDSDGSLVEVWRDRGSLFPGRPPSDVIWIDGEFAHGYGSRFFMNPDGTLWRDELGYAWLIYERVTEQKLSATYDGGQAYLPYKTEIRARRMKSAYQAFGTNEPLGQEVKVLDVEYKPGHFYENAKGSVRGIHGDRYLIEGPNPRLEKVGDFYVFSFSAGTYVEDAYGINIAYMKDEGRGPVGQYTALTGDDGNLVTFGSEFHKRGLHWGPARADFTRDSRGREWIIGHAIYSKDYPEGYILNGWPTNEHFNEYYRRQLIIPIRWIIKDGKPWLLFDE